MLSIPPYKMTSITGAEGSLFLDNPTPLNFCLKPCLADRGSMRDPGDSYANGRLVSSGLQNRVVRSSP